MDRTATSHLITTLSKRQPFTPSSYAVDLGSGTGNITTELHTRYPLLKILALDISSGMLEMLDAKILQRKKELAAAAPSKDQGLDISTCVLDAVDLNTRFGNEVFTHVFSTFMLQYTPRPKEVVQAVFKSLHHGGNIAIGLWGSNNGPIIIWQKACAATDSSYEVPHSHEEMAWTDVESLEAALTEAGFEDIESEVKPLDFGCGSTEELVRFWFGGGNPVPSRLVKAWVDSGRGLEGVRENYARIAREEYMDGRDVRIEVILTTASKR